MGIPCLILGESGSGKSSSLRNFEPEEVGIFNVASKPLPFRKQLKKADGATYQTIQRVLMQPELKRYVIDDSQFLLCFELFDRTGETGYTKFTEMAVHFYRLVKLVIEQTPPDVIVYFLHHTEQTDGRVKAKTIGKMLDEKLTLEGLFSIVLMAENENGEYRFRVKGNGSDTVKSPPEMFGSDRIDNDLKLVDEKIRDYWGLTTDNKNNDKESEEEK